MKITKYLHLAKKDKNGRVPIYFSVTANGWQHRFSTREKINPKFFDAGMVTSKQMGHFDINFRISQLYTYCEAYLSQMGRRLTKEAFCSHVKKFWDLSTPGELAAPPLSFFDLYDQWTVENKSKISPVSKLKISPETIRSIIATKKRLLAFEQDKKHRLTLSGMDQKFYILFREYMLTDLNQSVNTFSKHIRRVKAFLKWCEDNEHEVNVKFRKFAAFDVYGHIDALTEEELLRIYHLDFTSDDTKIFIHEQAKREGQPFTGLQIDQRVKTLEECRDLFLMCCYTGLRKSDLFRLKAHHIQGEFIKITTKKTNTLCYIPYYDDSVFKPVELVEKYRPSSHSRSTLFPVNEHINEYLKYIQKLAGIDRLNLTSKVGRKTFVTLKIYQGVSSRLIMVATGHKTELSFNRYAGIDTDKLLQEFKDKSR